MNFSKLLVTVLAGLTLTACTQTEIYYVYQNPDGTLQEVAPGQVPGQVPAPQAQNPQAAQLANMQQEMPAPAGTAKKPATNTKKTAGATAPAQVTAPTAPAANTATSTEGKILAKLKQSFDALNSLSATITNFEKGNDGLEGSGQIKMLYKKPSTVKIEVVKSPDAGQVGAKLLYSDLSNAKVRPGGGMGFMSLSLAMSDSKLLSGRKYQLGQIDLGFTVKRMTQAGVKAKLTGQSQIGSSKILLLEITPQ
ncbi:MAG: hypothetical protein ACK4IX_12725, partial [Candidatus Sericytochromatia bacterium]